MLFSMQYTSRMKTSAEILADNVRMIYLEQGITQQDIVDNSKGGVSLRHIQRVLRGDGGITLDKVDAIAKSLKVDPWVLIIPGYQPRDAKDPRFKQLVDNWLDASDESRDYISRFTSREVDK